MRAPSWAMAVVLVVGAALATAGVFMDWVTYSGKGYASWDRPFTAFVAGWMWLGLCLLAVGTVFAMVVAARRNYIPTLMALGAAIVSVVGAVLSMIAAVAAADRAAGAVATVWDDRARSLTEIPLHITPAPWLAVAGFAIATVAALVLWRIGVSTARQSEAELARANRELAARDVDLPSAPDQDPVPRL